MARRGDPSRIPARAQRDGELQVEVRRVFEGNLRVYGVRKVWRLVAIDVRGGTLADCGYYMPKEGFATVAGALLHLPSNDIISESRTP